MFRTETKVEQSFSGNLHSLVGVALAIGCKRAYLALMHRQVPMQATSSTRRKGMKMTPSNTFSIHAGCTLVRTHLQGVKRWQGTCQSKRM
jgi:hypothetical protein